MTSIKQALPTPLFDTQAKLAEQKLPEAITSPFAHQDFQWLKDFLLQYTGSHDTYMAYRRESERLVQWSWFVVKKSLLELRRSDIESYITFCQNPPEAWIGTKKVARFMNRGDERVPNPDWRLFVATTKKSATKGGAKPDIADYEFSQKALQSLFVSVSSFYNYLIREGLGEINPVVQIRQKSKFIRQQPSKRQIRRLTSLQWGFVIETAEKMANSNHNKYE